MRRRLLLLISSVWMGIFSFAQNTFHLTLSQPPLLEVNAGRDTTVCPLYPVVLGGLPAASGGSGDYYYSWTPQAGLDNPTSPNPVVVTDTTITYTLTVTDGRGCSVMSEITVYVDPCLGVDDRPLASSIRLYPNPAMNSFYVSGWNSGKVTSARAVLFNSLGQVKTDTKSLSLFSVDRLELDISHLASGLYYLKLMVDNELVVKPIQVIKH